MNNREAFEAWWGDAPIDIDPLANENKEHEVAIWAWQAWQAALASQAQQPTDLSKQLREYAADSGYSHNDYADTMLAAASEIERLTTSQAQQESQWISVEERLPEIAQKVFGIYDAGMCAFMRVRSEDDTWCWAIGRNDLYDDFFYDADDDYQVTHWMPLPPAPEGE